MITRHKHKYHARKIIGRSIDRGKKKTDLCSDLLDASDHDFWWCYLVWEKLLLKFLVKWTHFKLDVNYDGWVVSCYSKYKLIMHFLNVGPDVGPDVRIRTRIRKCINILNNNNNDDDRTRIIYISNNVYDSIDIM
jgi:hypothetical protein